MEQREQEEEKLVEQMKEEQELVKRTWFSEQHLKLSLDGGGSYLGSFLKTQKRELKMIKRGFQGQGGTFGETC